MSDNSDDDIWDRISKDAAEKASTVERERTQSLPTMEPADHTRGTLEKRPPIETLAQKMAWETTEEEADGPPLPTKRRRKSKSTPTLLIGSIIVALLWVAGAGLFLINNASTFGADGSTLLFSLVVLLLGPAFSLLAGFMGEGIAKSNREARILMTAARRMLEPEQSGEKAIKSTALAVQSEIGRLEGAIGLVADRLRSIEGTIDSQTTALSAAGDHARGGADHLVATMENERARLNNLLAAMTDLTTRAQTSTQVAGENIDQRTLKLAQVADALVDKSALASHAADDAAQRLDLAAQRAVHAIGQLDVAAERGEAALARAHDLMMAARLRANETIGSVGSAVTALHDAAASASETARVVSDTIQSETNMSRDAGLATVEQIRAATLVNARVITESLRQEADAARVAGAETLAALQGSAEAVRLAAEEARQQTSQQIADNQKRLDSVRQTAFEVSKDTDGFMQTRMTDARALIEKSAGLLDETGTKIQERFTKLAAACADQARGVEDLLDTLDRRLATLPQEATARAQAIEAALDDTLTRLTEAGRKAADETAALDTAFQERLRDSYAALGEVVQRLGGLSGVMAAPTAPAARTEISRPTPAEKPLPLGLRGISHETSAPISTSRQQPTATPQAVLVPRDAAPSVPIEQTPTSASSVKAPPPTLPVAAPETLIAQPSRLKISSPVPIEDDPFAELQLGRAPPTTADGESGWSWKQVLSTLDEKGAKSENSRISNLLNELNLETALTDGALEKLRAAAGRSRDQGRRGTRELLPDEVRAMRRKLTSDPDLRASIVRFVESRREAASRGRLLGNEARVYLVADAALEA